jgi:nucleoside-diphosphate-sugar epimerase
MQEKAESTTAASEGSRSSGKEVVMVTGASGLIGSAVIKRLSENYRMIGFDKGTDSLPPVASEMIYMDITSEKSIAEAMQRVRFGYGKKIASVIHLAAYYDFAGKPSPLYDKITVEGTRKLLKALQGFELQQFIFSSSLLVYKPCQPGQKINEEWPLLPKWDYPVSKVKSEKVLHAERKDLPVLVLRIAGVYNDQGSSIPIAHHIQRIYEKQLTSHFFPGDVSHGNPYVHLDDLVNAIAKAIEKRNELPRETTINIGEEETLSYDYLQKTIGQLIHQREWTTYRIPKLFAKTGARVQDLFGDPFIKAWMIDMADDHMELDIGRARQLLDWQPRHSLRDTLPKMIAALKVNPVEWYRLNHLKK